MIAEVRAARPTALSGMRLKLPVLPPLPQEGEEPPPEILKTTSGGFPSEISSLAILSSPARGEVPKAGQAGLRRKGG